MHLDVVCAAVPGMRMLNGAARKLIESGALAHLVTINKDGSPQISVVFAIPAPHELRLHPGVAVDTR